MKAKSLVYLLAVAGVLFFFYSFRQTDVYLSPGAMAADTGTGTLYTALSTAGAIAVTDIKTGRTAGRISLKQSPNRILLSHDGKTLFAATGEAQGTIELIALPKGKTKASIAVGHTPDGMALSPDGKWLYVSNRFSNTVSVIDVSKNKVIADIPAVREPRALYVSPDGRTVAAANFLPAQASTDGLVAAQITLINAPDHRLRSQITLPDGAQSVTGLAGSPDGKYLYAVHLLSRYGMPITQLDRGWVNTNALSIIDLQADSLYATVLLDDVDRGAANPAGICTGDSGQLSVALSGTHELMTVDMHGLHGKLAAFFSGRQPEPYIHSKDDLSSSLSFAMPFKKRIALNGRSPRDLVQVDGKIYVSSYFSSFLDVVETRLIASPHGHERIDTETRLIASLPLGNEPPMDAVRRGALAFGDASICYQQWQSCISCHPDGRADGLNWDQQNDGLGNPKNTKSLLYSHVTPPCMITGIRESAELAVRKGILHTLETRQPESLAADMDEYLKNMRPVASPFLNEYKRKDPQQTGKKLFEQAGCTQCHSGKYLTDQQKYDVGTGDGDDKGRAFDTPSLCEIWRTAPYLYDGRAKTLREVFTRFNPDGRHGFTGQLSDKELDALVLYVNTL